MNLYNLQASASSKWLSYGAQYCVILLRSQQSINRQSFVKITHFTDIMYLLIWHGMTAFLGYNACRVRF